MMNRANAFLILLRRCLATTNRLRHLELAQLNKEVGDPATNWVKSDRRRIFLYRWIISDGYGHFR